MCRNPSISVATILIFCWIGISTQVLADELRVKDLPIPEEATEITYLKRRGDVRFQMASDFKTVGSFYLKKLTESKWTKSGRDNLQRNFQVQTFTKGNVSLEVRVDSRGTGSEVRLTPTGMMWEEDDQPTPKDLPLPADAAEIEYDDFFESIEFTCASDVKTVAEFLSQELEKREWTKAATEFDLATFVRMKFTKQKSTLDIDVRAEDSGCEVAIRTKGMQWDGMKAEIEKAEEEAEKMEEKIAAEEKQRAADTPLTLPKRKDKPKQGIGDLPKLPSEGTVVMDGKTLKLPHVIAYEVYENDEWSTKIVATEKPIKQETLLARLRKTGTDKDEDDSPPSWAQPWLQVVVDEADQPWRMSLLADGTPGGSSSDELTGTALVEDGRARGTVAMNEPDSFFDKVYTAEISFDVPVLTHDSTPAKRLTDASRLTNSGKLTIGGKTYNLANVVGYRMKQFDEPMTKIVLSDKPLNLTKLKATLGKEAADDYFEFTPQVTLVVDNDDNVKSLSIWADNSSISSSGNSDLVGDIVIEDGRARGTAGLAQPGKFSDTTYNFEVSFDVDILGTQVTARNTPEGGLVADAWDGLPIPEGHEGMQSEGSRFRKQANTKVVAELSRVVDFYRRELASGEWGDWKENAADAKVEQRSARLAFNGPAGNLTVKLESEGSEVAITLVSRDAQAAKAAGLLPAAGKSRLLVGNASEQAAVITINKQDYKVAAGAGAEDPKTGLNWEVAPGNYTVEMKPPGEPVQSEKLQLGPNETWGVIIGESGGYLAVQLY
jgi:hypothetical protein